MLRKEIGVLRSITYCSLIALRASGLINFRSSTNTGNSFAGKLAYYKEKYRIFIAR